MALISTPYGDLQANIQMTDGLMSPAKVTFAVPIRHPLVQAGAFNAWQPIDVTVWDGDVLAGTFPGNAIPRDPAMQFSAYVTWPKRNLWTLEVEAHDAAIYLQRRTVTRPTSVAKPAGQHVADLLANATANERRAAAALIPVDTTGNSVWNGGVGSTPSDGLPAASFATAAAAGVTTSYRQIDATGFGFSTTTNPTTVKVRLQVGATDGVTWANTLDVSTDGGATWLASHAFPAVAETDDIWIDVSGDTSWTAALLGDDLRLRITTEASATDVNEAFWIVYVEIEAGTTTQDSPYPILLGEIQPGGPVITLPDQRKTLLDWLNYLSDETGWEWSTKPFGTGRVAISWQERVGTDVDVIQETVVSGAAPELLSLEEGQLIDQPVQAGIDGLTLYSQVRVTASGLPDVVLTNATLATLIGIHELVIDLGTNATVDDQTNMATQKLKELASPTMALSLVIPRTPALWGVLQNGNTVIVRLAAAPVNGYEGVARIVGRNLNEAAGTLTLDVLTVQDLGFSILPVGSGLTVQAPVTTRKQTPAEHRRRQFVGWLELLRRLARG